jgi:lysozyme
MPLLNAIVDLSHHNTVTSFEEARADGVLAIIHKATEGTTFVDAKYAERQARAKAAGLLWGAYHFGTKGAAPEQVSHFLETANPTATDLLVLDFEPNSREATMTLTEAEVFVEALRERTGRQPGLYSGQSFLRERLGNRVDSPLTDCFCGSHATRFSCRSCRKLRTIHDMAVHRWELRSTATPSHGHWPM